MAVPDFYNFCSLIASSASKCPLPPSTRSHSFCGFLPPHFLCLVASSPTPFLLPHGFQSLTVSTPSSVSTPSQSLPPPSSSFLVLCSSQFLLPRGTYFLRFHFLTELQPPHAPPMSCGFSVHPFTCSCHFSSPVVSLLPTDASERKNLVGLRYSYLGRSPPTGLPHCLIDSWPAYGLAVLDQVPSMVLSPVGGLIRPRASSGLGLW